MRKTVMVVEDAVFMRKLLVDLLQENDFEVVGEADNGIDAVEKYKTLKPDIVTMDITMPQMNGIDALRKIKEFDQNALVVMCSAIGQQQMVIESINAGAKEFILKPFENGKVIQVLNSTLEK